MIHPQDEQSLLRMLGTGPFPVPLMEEYEFRLSLFHRDGHSGPLGSIGLIDLVRSMRLGVRPAAKTDVRVNWRDLPQDGTTRVEARFFGAWQPGVFLGFVEAGTLAVRLDEDPIVRECRGDMVRLVGVREPQAKLEEPDARASLLENTGGDEKPVEANAAGRGDTVSPVPAKEAAAEVAEEEPDMDAPPRDWATVPAGARVWVEHDGDYRDATFVSQAPDGELVVAVGEETLTVAAAAVTYAGE